MEEDFLDANLPLSGEGRASINKKLNQQKIENDTVRDLRKNPRYQDFFRQFNSLSVESFIRDYARKKASYLLYGDNYLRWEEDKRLQYQRQAWECLWEIQQKKLFNFQCLWRAEQVSNHAVESVEDFSYWQDAIKKCPFIDPITADEVELYQAFLNSLDFSTDPFHFTEWQDYETFRENYQQGDEEDHSLLIPEWYVFYDTLRGTGNLLIMPDVRGKKEKSYLDIFLADLHRKQKKPRPVSVPVETLPYLMSGHQDIFDFMKQFEDPKILQYYRAIKKYTSNDFVSNYELSEAEEILKEADELVPIEGHSDWREAMIIAAQQYRQRQIARELPSVYQQYQFIIENQTLFEETKIELDRQRATLKRVKRMKDNVLKGRHLNGDPKNFDF